MTATNSDVLGNPESQGSSSTSEKKTVGPAGGTTPAGTRQRSSLVDFAEKWATLIAFALMIGGFWLDQPDTFGTKSNLLSILDQAAVPVLLGVGLTAVLAVDEFDLSFPYILGLSSAAATLTMTKYHMGTPMAVIIGVAIGVVAGAIGGLLVAQQRVSSFVITLGLGFVWIGITDGATNSQVITDGVRIGFINLTSHSWGGVTISTFIAGLFAVLIGVIFKWTVLGRNLLAVGSNRQASRLAGLHLSALRITAYAIMGLAVGIAAVIMTSRQAQYTPSVGTGYFLSPYVSAFFGMSVLGAKRFNVFGTVVGGLFMGTLQTGLVIIGAPSWVGEFIQGAVLLVILMVARRKA